MNVEGNVLYMHVLVDVSGSGGTVEVVESSHSDVHAVPSPCHNVIWVIQHTTATFGRNTTFLKPSTCGRWAVRSACRIAVPHPGCGNETTVPLSWDQTNGFPRRRLT